MLKISSYAAYAIGINMKVHTAFLMFVDRSNYNMDNVVSKALGRMVCP